MDRDLCLSLDEDFAELIDADGEIIWSSDDDDEFDFDHGMPANDVIAYLVRSDVIDSEKEVSEIVDERPEFDNDDSDDDDEESEFDDDDD